MHALVVRVTVGDFEKAQKALREEVVPRVSQQPGFVAGYWTRPSEGNSQGLSLVIFADEAAARAAAEVARAAPMPETVTLNDVEVREVVAHAAAPVD